MLVSRIFFKITVLALLWPTHVAHADEASLDAAISATRHEISRVKSETSNVQSATSRTRSAIWDTDRAISQAESNISSVRSQNVEASRRLNQIPHEIQRILGETRHFQSERARFQSEGASYEAESQRLLAEMEQIKGDIGELLKQIHNLQSRSKLKEEEIAFVLEVQRTTARIQDEIEDILGGALDQLQTFRELNSKHRVWVSAFAKWVEQNNPRIDDVDGLDKFEQAQIKLKEAFRSIPTDDVLVHQERDGIEKGEAFRNQVLITQKRLKDWVRSPGLAAWVTLGQPRGDTLEKLQTLDERLHQIQQRVSRHESLTLVMMSRRALMRALVPVLWVRLLKTRLSSANASNAALAIAEIEETLLSGEQYLSFHALFGRMMDRAQRMFFENHLPQLALERAHQMADVLEAQMGFLDSSNLSKSGPTRFRAFLMDELRKVGLLIEDIQRALKSNPESFATRRSAFVRTISVQDPTCLRLKERIDSSTQTMMDEVTFLAFIQKCSKRGI